MKCKICGRSIPESIGECVSCNDGILKQKEGIPESIGECVSCNDGILKQKEGIPQNIMETQK